MSVPLSSLASSSLLDSTKRKKKSGFMLMGNRDKCLFVSLLGRLFACDFFVHSFAYLRVCFG